MTGIDDFVQKLEKHDTKDVNDNHTNGSLTVIWRDYDQIIPDSPKMVYVSYVNTGEIKGQEVVQCYVRDLDSSLDRPLKELKAFYKVSLLPGESSTVDISLDASSFSFFDDRINKWIIEPGKFEIMIGSSSKDIRLKQIINFNN